MNRTLNELDALDRRVAEDAGTFTRMICWTLAAIVLIAALAGYSVGRVTAPHVMVVAEDGSRP